MSPPCRGGGGGVLAGLNDLTGYACGNFMFLVGPPKPNSRTREARLRETNWFSKNADGLVTLPRKTKCSKAKTDSLGYRRIK